MEVLRSMRPNPDSYTVMNFDTKDEWQHFKSRLSKFNNSEGKQCGKFIHGHFPKGKSAYLVCVDLPTYLIEGRLPETRNKWLWNLKKN